MVDKRAQWSSSKGIDEREYGDEWRYVGVDEWVTVCMRVRCGVGAVYERAVWQRIDRIGRLVKWVVEAEVCSVVVEHAPRWSSGDRHKYRNEERKRELRYGSGIDKRSCVEVVCTNCICSIPVGRMDGL
jgi:hypothetical protein